jgi:hypothetical protein
VDNHAEQSCVGKHVLILKDWNRPVQVQGYDPKGKPFTAKTVTAAVAYQDMQTGDIIILIIHQALWIPHLEHNLLSPMQMWMNDVSVNCTPKFLTDNPDEETHSIVLHDNETESKIVIPMSLHRTNSYFPTFKPTMEQFESCRQFELTAERPDWDPSNSIFAEQEDAMLDSRGQLKQHFADRGQGRQISKILSEHTPIPIPPKLSDTFTDEAAFLKSLETLVKVSSLQLHKPPTKIPTTTISSLEVGKPIPTMTPETLAKNFGVSTDIAK